MEFTKGVWNEEINVRDFIQNNYTPYDGDESFLASPTARTKQLWDELCVLLEAERKALEEEYPEDGEYYEEEETEAEAE